MSVIAILISGFIVGFLADKIMNTNHSMIWTILLGIVGATVGDFLFGIIGFHTTGLASLISSVVGACIVIMIANRISNR